MGIRDNWETVCARIAAAAARAGRDPRGIEIVCVTKTVGEREAREAYEAGARVFGENRFQDAAEKLQRLADLMVRWDFIGHLQRNKARPVVEAFDRIHSVDSLRLAQEISKRAENAGKTMPVLVQVDVFGEERKFGADPAGLDRLVEEAAALPCLRIEGLMAMAPFVEDPEDVRAGFARLRTLGEGLRGRRIAQAPMSHLSMGMTNDYAVAVEEGSTLVRIGSAIFADR